MNAKNRNKPRHVCKDGEVATKEIPISKLVYADYQRDWDEDKSKEIARIYVPKAICTIIVSYRDGRFWVVDGQHRVKALEILKYTHVKCDIRKGMTYEEEADLFYLINFIKKPQKARDKVNSVVESGRDETYEHFVEATNNEGYTFYLKSKKDSGNGRMHIKAIDTAKRIYDSLGYKKYRQMLFLINETWGNNKDSVSSNMLCAMSIMVKLYCKDIEVGKFATRLGKENPRQLENVGKFHRGIEGTPTAIARQIFKAYNRGCTKKRLPDKFDEEM